MQKYNFSRYVYFSRWASYWHQLAETLKDQPETVLLIGVGDRLVVQALKEYGSAVTTLDIEESLKPDAVGSVEVLPFPDASFDAVVCAEVLEHLPFDRFEIALGELARVSKGRVVLSLPHFGPPVKLLLKIPFFPEIRLAFKIPVPLRHVYNGEHHWEIGKRGYAVQKIRAVLRQFFIIEKEFVPFENQYHHFFILEKHG